MDTQKSRFNRTLLIVLIVLYALTIAAFSYVNWVADPQGMKWWMILLNIPILSIPLVLLFGSVYVLAVAWREHASQGRVNPRLAKIIHWAPRAAAILIILFLSLFSLDVFEMQAPPLEILGAFLVHNLPSLAMLALLILAWKRPAVGFVVFLVAGALFGVFFVRDIYALPNLLLFALPILLVALLFYADWKWLVPDTEGPANAAG
jgi:uncharacterized membrane protein YidH (DUF202 family)